MIEFTSAIQAACAVALVIFTALLFCANRGMQAATQTAAEAAKQSAAATTEQLQLLNRPRVEIYADNLISVGTKVGVYYTVVNSGNTNATIQRQRITIWRKYTNVPWPVEQFPSGASNDFAIPPTFEAHDSRSSNLTLTLSADEGLHPMSDWDRFKDLTMLVCMSGYVLYTDATGEKKYETFFCRAWSIEGKKFSIHDETPPSFNRAT